MSIIGITGRAGSGKDTFADLDTFADFKKEFFAEPIKEAVIILFGLTREHVYDEKLKEEIIMDSNGKPLWYINGKPASPRLILQWLGTDIIRKHVDENFFVKRMAQKISKSKSNVIITDVRFENEAKFIKDEQNGPIFKIVRPELDKKFVNKQVHASEQGIPPEYISHTILNEENRLDLLEEQSKFVRSYFLPPTTTTTSTTTSDATSTTTNTRSSISTCTGNFYGGFGPEF